jgi:hypothetical protein
MKLALAAVLLAFAAPIPIATTALCLEEDIALESARGSKSSSVRVHFRKAPPQEQAAPAVRPAVRTVEVALPFRNFPEWAPRLFSRPPPRA